MKHLYSALVLSFLSLAVPAGAQVGLQPADESRLKIIQTEDAVFPLTLLNSTVLNGDATVAIDVDKDGRLTDWLVTAYSRKEFADSAVAALQRWQYEPPRLKGKPWASVQELRLEYTRTGVVVNLTGFEAFGNLIDELTKAQYVYRTYALRELDRIPTPVTVVSPVVSPAVAPPLARDQTKHAVTVEFYIDQEGRVRVRSVAREEAGTVYAASALKAVRQWRFEPPLYQGRAVLVRARQVFNFVPKP